MNAASIVSPRVSTATLTTPSQRETRLHAAEAQNYARQLAHLALEARQSAAQIMLGMHGARKAGVGENFWQFRPFHNGEPAQNIDWRRSARDHKLFVREREWEAPNTWWLWLDRSPSMDFISHAARASKAARAHVFTLALAEILVRNGERVGIWGLTPPLSKRNIIDHFCNILLQNPAGAENLPVAHTLKPREKIILISDFIVREEAFSTALHSLNAAGGSGIALMLRDPAEAEFPFSGTSEFTDVESGIRWEIGEATTQKSAYLNRINAHEAGLRAAAIKHNFRFLKHITAATTAAGLMACAQLLEGRA